MTLRQATAVGAVAIVAALLSAGAAMAAAPGTVSGKLASGTAKLPESASRGEAQVLAMNIDTAAYGGASEVTRRGRYKLTLPAGKWALRSSIVALGKPFVSFTSATIRTRSGQRRKLPLTLKRFKKPRKRVRRRHRPRRAPPPRAANINPRDGRPYPGEAFGIEKFSVIGGGDLAVLGNGMADMLTTDLMSKPKCEFTLVEWRRRDELLAEIKLSQSEYVDPSTRIEPGHVIDPEILIRGRVEDRPGSYRTFTATTGSVDITVEATPPGDCRFDGSGHIELIPGFLNQIIVQLDVANPAYVIRITGLPSDVIQVTKSGGAGCTGTTPLPVFAEWASTGTFAHTSPSFALVDSQAELTPAVPFDYDYTTRWNFAPG
jgi:hypothetical protein